MDEVINEAGIEPVYSLYSWWTRDSKHKLAYGVAMFGRRLKGGISRLNELLGGHVEAVYGYGLSTSSWAPPPPFSDGNRVEFVHLEYTLETAAQIVVHELAHVMDWQSGPPGQRFSDRWSGAAITDYADSYSDRWPNRRWERWAESVTAWVFQDLDGGNPYGTTYRDQKSLLVSSRDLERQMRALTIRLGGWEQ